MVNSRERDETTVSLTVQRALDDYLHRCAEILPSFTKPKPEVHRFRVVSSDSQRLAILCEEAEASAEFTSLAQALSGPYLSYLSKLYAEHQVARHPGLTDSEEQCLKSLLKEYLRRSRAYLTVASGHDPTTLRHLARDLTEHVTTGRRNVLQVLRPLGLVGMATPPRQCGLLELRNYTESELDELLLNDVRRVFYPNAVIDTKRFSQFTYLTVAGRSTRAERDGVTLIRGEIPLSLEDLSEPEPRAILVVLLADWKKYDLDASPPHPNQESGEELKTRYELPDLSVELFPEIGLERDVFVPTRVPEPQRLRWVWDQDHEEEESPEICLFVNGSQCEELGCFLTETSRKLEKVLSVENWEFFRVAASMYLRAYRASGIERYLWTIAALESLIGSPEKTSKTIGGRLAAFLGTDEMEKEKLRDFFTKEIYQLRCDFLHGNKALLREWSKEGKGKAELVHAAWELCRRVFLWMIDRCAEEAESQGSKRGRSKLLRKLETEARMCSSAR